MATKTPIDEEIFFDASDIIVSKTDKTGSIIYANDIFCTVAEAALSDVIDRPHSCIRHPDMPRAIFAKLWGEIEAGREIFAYVKNMSLSGRFYWVFAHITPSRAADGSIVGYHSNRRVPNRSALKVIEPLYRDLRAIETRDGNRKEALAASIVHLDQFLADRGTDYDAFVWGLENTNV